MKVTHSRRHRGFSLIEVMVASVISLTVITAATALAFGLMRANTSARASGQVNTRVALAHSFFNASLGNAGYLWHVDQDLGSSMSTATFGQGYSAIDSGPTLPLRICDGLTAGCATPVAANPDKLIAIVPRDDILDAVRIVEAGVPPLDADCAALASAATFDVEGDTFNDWSVGDLVVVASTGHVSFASMSTNFAASGATDGGLAQRTGFTVDFGATPSNIELDDGGRTTACDARRSLIGAKVIRVKVLQFRLSGNELQLSESTTEGQLGALSWVTLLAGVDDLQFQLDLAMFPASSDNTSTARTCRCNTTDVLAGSAFTAATCPGCTVGERLNGDAGDDEVYRLIGLRIGFTIHGDVETNAPPKTWSGMFDRQATAIVTDRRVRRKSTLYLGLPNATTF